MAPATEHDVQDERPPPYCLRCRAEGPVDADVSPWRVLPRQGWTNRGERARGRRGATDQIRAPRNRDPRQAEAGPLVESCPDCLAPQPPSSMNDAPAATAATARTPLKITTRPRRSPGAAAFTAKTPKSGLLLRRIRARSAIGGSTTLCDQSFDAVSAAISRLVAKDRGSAISSWRNPASTERSQRAVQLSHAAGLYRAAGSWLP
jgi:hypothetical protein